MGHISSIPPQVASHREAAEMRLLDVEDFVRRLVSALHGLAAAGASTKGEALVESLVEHQSSPSPDFAEIMGVLVTLRDLLAGTTFAHIEEFSNRGVSPKIWMLRCNATAPV